MKPAALIVLRYWALQISVWSLAMAALWAIFCAVNELHCLMIH